MKIIIFTVSILTSLYFILNTFPVFAQSKILINEFLIDPQPQSVEIFNSGTESADISDWIIDDSGGTTFYSIPKNNIIFPDQCLVYSADLNLNKTSPDTIRLLNSSQQLVDSFSYKSSSGSGVSYFRSPDGLIDWATGSADLGFYNQTGVTCLTTPTPEITITISPTSVPTIITPTITPPIPTETSIPTSTPTLKSYDNIYISEVMINPQTGEKEWAEIYNDNDFSVSLNDWYIDDLENAGSTPKIFSLEIDKKSYAVFDLSSSMFNNDGDNIRLLDHKKDLKDDLEYNKTDQGKTLGRTHFDSDDFCIQEPSKSSINNPCVDPTPTPTPFRPTGFTGQAATVKTNTSDVLITVYQNTNYPPGIIMDSFNGGKILGVTEELITDHPNNGSVIDLLTTISVSYSLLTIGSILFKMKLSYGKDKNFYSSTLRPSRRK
ncbi:lamin tail domain-containing protein [Candidatus Microgenomates bacterium]|nr:MAG: lamin tail domain-containing protein [Candidatus Microgenomates bacterium]